MLITEPIRRLAEHCRADSAIAAAIENLDEAMEAADKEDAVRAYKLAMAAIPRDASDALLKAALALRLLALQVRPDDRPLIDTWINEIAVVGARAALRVVEPAGNASSRRDRKPGSSAA